MTFGYAACMTKQVAVKLPDGLIREVDRLVEDGAFESRSQAIRSGLEAMVSNRRRGELDQRYADAMVRFPETDAELAEASRLAIDAVHEEPWTPWW